MDGKIVAYYSVDERNDNLFINSIQVLKGYRNQGLGARMMERIEVRAKENRLMGIELWVQITNRSAMEFYRHMGYRMVSRQGNNYLMRRRLDPQEGWRFV
jgi:ribosomal protein S18 acetylase RimI-like enzyme